MGPVGSMDGFLDKVSILTNCLNRSISTIWLILLFIPSQVSDIRQRIGRLNDVLGPLAAAHQRLLAAPSGNQQVTAKSQVDQQEADANSLVGPFALGLHGRVGLRELTHTCSALRHSASQTRGIRNALTELNDNNRHRPQPAEEYMRRRQHLEGLQNLFKKTLGARLDMDRECRRQARLVAERQYRIGKPSTVHVECTAGKAD
jgi:hypothetical protein